MGNEIVLVALISAGGALLAAIMTQFLATRAAAKQAARTEKQEALQWQRSEAKRTREQHEARLRELWAHVLRAQNAILDVLDARLSSKAALARAASDSATGAAAQAYSVALIGLPAVRPLVKDFYEATARIENLIRNDAKEKSDEAGAWWKAFDALEAAVIAESTTL